VNTIIEVTNIQKITHCINLFIMRQLNCKKCAGKREIFLKSGVGRKFLDLISDSVSP
jgi:hypothetical protein